MKNKAALKKTIFILTGVLIVGAIVFIFIRLRPPEKKQDITTQAYTIPQQTALIELSGKNDTIDDYKYVLKESYSSREEIFQEKLDLAEYTNAFSYDKDDDFRNAAYWKQQELMEVLDNELRKIPKSEAEILSEKERALNSRIEFYTNDCLYSAYYLVKAHPDVEEYAEEYRHAKERADFAEDIDKKYKNGKITIDEAMEALDIQYDINAKP